MPELNDYRKIRETRRAIRPRVSQRVLAERAGVSRLTVLQLENGRCSPNITTVERLLGALETIARERRQETTQGDQDGQAA